MYRHYVSFFYFNLPVVDVGFHRCREVFDRSWLDYLLSSSYKMSTPMNVNINKRAIVHLALNIIIILNRGRISANFHSTHYSWPYLYRLTVQQYLKPAFHLRGTQHCQAQNTEALQMLLNSQDHKLTVSSFVLLLSLLFLSSSWLLLCYNRFAFIVFFQFYQTNVLNCVWLR